MKVKDLAAADYNPRKINEKQLSQLNRSMKKFGDLSGVVFNVRTGNMVGGHQRIKNLDPEWEIVKRDCSDRSGTVSAGYVDTPFGRWSYREVDWDDATEKAANLAANKHGGQFDMPKVNLLIEELKEIDFDIELTGFDIKPDKLDDDDGSDQVIGDVVYQVVIECDGEMQQVELIRELEERGIRCRPLML